MGNLSAVPLPQQKTEPVLNEHLTDSGNAKRLVRLYGKGLRFFLAKGVWLIWVGSHWAVDESLNIVRFAKAAAEALYDEARKLRDFELAEKAKKASLAAEGRAKIDAAIELAKSEPGVIVQADQLDQDPWLLNVKNGTIDLRTGELHPHDPQDMITKIVNIEYAPEPGNECPRWENFLFEIFAGNMEMVRYIQRAIGYTLTGSTSEQVLFFLYGLGANGKSVFLNILTALLSSYWTTVVAETFMLKNDGGGATPELAKMISARLVTANELGEGRRMDEATVKLFTGGDIVSARQLYREPIEFRPVFKLWMAGNHKPDIRGMDDGIWRRIHLVPYAVTFPPEKRDKDLEQKLLAELPGILRWAVQGCLEWQRVGLNPPAVVTSATDEYRSEMDIIGLWLAECCRLDPTAETSAGDLYRSYRKWAESNGHRCLSQKKLGATLRDRGFESRKASSIYWSGLEVLSEYAAATQGAF